MPFGSYVVVYLFLAGAGAGAFFLAACGAFYDAARATDASEDIRENLSGGFLAAPPLLALGALCLLLDLGSPQRALLVLANPLVSVMSFGAWCLLLLTVASVAVAALGLAEKFPPAFMRTGCLVGLVLSPLVMAYTGVLLCTMVSVDFWNTPLLAVLFVCSSLSTGFAASTLANTLMKPLTRISPRAMGKLARLFHAAETVALIAFLASRFFATAAAQGSCVELLAGTAAPIFWCGVVVCGLLVPLVVSAGHARIAMLPAGRIIVASCSLIGGLALRYGIVAAATYTAITVPII
ncbi:MAG: polysulfide reductase NrfD [Eggerthellales bacterium]|nr:polysulfide reductase NrfD [Eggerthellales bacterium]